MNPNTVALLVFAAIAALVVLWPVLARAGRLLVALGYTRTNPAVAPRSTVISTVTGISADTDDADAAAGYYEVPRGAERISFDVLATLNTGFSSGSAFFKCQILGANDPSETFVPIVGLVTAELVVDVGQRIPAAADAAGVTLPRFLKVRWDETGAMTSFTATCRINYELAVGAGRQYSADYAGG